MSASIDECWCCHEVKEVTGHLCTQCTPPPSRHPCYCCQEEAPPNDNPREQLCQQCLDAVNAYEARCIRRDARRAKRQAAKEAAATNATTTPSPTR